MAPQALKPLRIALAGAVRMVRERRREVRVGVAMAVPMIMPMRVIVPMIVVMMSVVAMRMIMVMVMAVMVIVMMRMIVVMPMVMPVVMPVRRPGADAFHVMVVALLDPADLGLVADRLLAVFAHLAVHRVVAGEDLAHPLGEGVEHQGMVVEIARLEELDLRMARRHLVGDVVDPLHQYAREEEIGEHDDALVAELHSMLEPGADEREGDDGIAHLGPAKAHAFPQHARDLGDVGVGVGVGGAAPDYHQQRLGARHL